ncbi:biopolymer transport protein ExbD [Pseudovibrio axinellae]|uniref:Biopolymer transport protein ExbD n=1 Tax=Pseudovibrio axinellae TaxID=989403 RepID=A0A165ZS78_9HYPH|nr:biopolymer transporter ExbD [Pseudovibrio axinellae]KZL20222.1 biopolymer transport protein ExbD [Pseudovibrio axinellae]SEQ61592.1 outer membrane transport energization protein ExbD [Pseudovibrio axinellae]
MRLSEVPKRNRAPGLTSLIDVIFLLLMFFMLASTFSVYQRLDVTSGSEGASELDHAPVLLQVFAQGQLFMNGKSMRVEALDARLGEAGIAKQQPIAVIPAKDSTVQDLVHALETLKFAGWSATVVGN